MLANAFIVKALERIMTKTANTLELILRVYYSRAVGFILPTCRWVLLVNAFNSRFNFQVRKSVNLQAHAQSSIDACGSSYTVAVRPFR